MECNQQQLAEWIAALQMIPHFEPHHIVELETIDEQLTKILTQVDKNARHCILILGHQSWIKHTFDTDYGTLSSRHTAIKGTCPMQQMLFGHNYAHHLRMKLKNTDLFLQISAMPKNNFAALKGRLRISRGNIWSNCSMKPEQPTDVRNPQYSNTSSEQSRTGDATKHSGNIPN